MLPVAYMPSKKPVENNKLQNYMSQFILESARGEYITRDTQLGQCQGSSLPDLIWTPSHLTPGGLNWVERICSQPWLVPSW